MRKRARLVLLIDRARAASRCCGGVPISPFCLRLVCVAVRVALTGAGWTLPAFFTHVQAGDYYTIEVVDSATGRGVPLIQVESGGQTFTTDSNGVVALDAPTLVNQSLTFNFASYGYESTSRTLTTTLGANGLVAIDRRNRAERLYRATGWRIYEESVKVGRGVPIANPLSNANIMGQDSVMATEFKGQIYWFWGDSLYEDGGGIGGNYWTSGATSQLPGQGGLDPSEGIDYAYFEDALGRSRPMFPTYQSSGSPVWTDGLFTVKNPSGHEKLFAHYVHVDTFLPTYKLHEQGLAIFLDGQGHFSKFKEYDVAPEQQWGRGQPIYPLGNSFRHSTGGEDYIYFGENYPNVRVRDDWFAVTDIGQWEAFTPLQENTRYDAANPPLDLDEEGNPVYGWKKNTDPIGTEIFEEMVANNYLNREQAPIGLVDYETGAPVKLHRGSVSWNEFRQKWIMIGTSSFGGDSFLGEVWFAEAPTPEGPWKQAVKVVTHGDPTGELGGSYSYYNPKHLPFFDQDGGRLIHFHGTYSTNFFDTAPDTPLYEYNQIAYRLDLSTIPQLAADVFAADFNADGLVDQFDLGAWQEEFAVSDGGDADSDGQTSGVDLLYWQQQLGNNNGAFPSRSTGVAVPEAGSGALLAAAWLACGFIGLGGRAAGRS